MALSITIEQELGHLVLAVVQAGAYISRTKCGLRRYLKMYQERRGELFEDYKSPVQKTNDHLWTVYTTWVINFEQLGQQATTVLKICAFLHHNGISEVIFRKAAHNLMTFVPLLPTNEGSDALG